MEPVTLTAEGLTLRPPEDGDLPELASAMTDPDVLRWTLVPADWEKRFPANFASVALRQWHDDGNYRWVITDGERVLGMVNLTPKRHGVMEIAYWTSPWARGGGVAERAARAVITWAFDVVGCPRVEWDAIVGNHASRLLALKLGFTMTGRQRASLDQRGERRDTWTGDLLPGELRATPPPRYDVARARAVAFGGEQPVLETSVPGLRLRPMLEEDTDALVRMCGDAEAQQWITTPVPYERSHAEWYLGFGRRSWLEGAGPVWILADAEGACGTIDLRVESADVGFHTAFWARGRGYMTAALEAVCAYGFDVLLMDRIAWKAYVGNEGSRRVAEKAGFVFEGTLRQSIAHRGGEMRDAWLAARLKQDPSR